MGFSLIAEGLLQYHLPRSGWAELISKLGYSTGFLIVILGRQQLFTENTLTPILPLLKHKNFRVFLNVLRLWSIVLTANLLGGLAVAWVSVATSAFEPGVREQFVQLGQEAMAGSFGTILLRGVFAGWLIALMVWLLPFAEAGRIWVIIILTYLVGLGHFSHIIAGAIKVFALAFHGGTGWWSVCSHYLAPTLIGNMMGGITLVAALNHAQVVSGAEGEDV